MVKAYFKRRVTLMVVPHEGGKPIHIRLPLPFLHVLLFLAVTLMGWALSVVSKDLYDAETIARAHRMGESVREIQMEMKSNRDLLERMQSLDGQLRQVLKLKKLPKGMTLDGMGGPSVDDENQLERLLDEKNDETLSKLSLGVKTQAQQVQERERSFKEIQLLLDKQRSTLAAKPDIWPVKGWITSGFGRRMSPLTGEPGRHMGVDIANELNSPIRVTADGVVTYAGWQNGYGRLVVVEHGFGYSTRYGHCARLNVSVGQEVKRGDVVGFIGSSGRSTGSHCHYEVRIHGVPVDPMKYLPALN